MVSRTQNTPEAPRGAARPRIAVVSTTATQLTAQLSAVAHDPVVRHFRDLYADAEAIHRFEAGALFLCSTVLHGEDAGALRMLRALLPQMSIVLVCAPEHEVAARTTADRIGAAVAIAPCSRRELTSVVESALTARPRPSAEALIDLARGISDEINNPLMFVGGHVQLLEQALREQPNLHEQIQLVQDGLARVTATMRSIELLARTGESELNRKPVDLGRLLHATAVRHDAAAARPAAAAAVAVHGDEELLAALLEHLWRVAAAAPQPGPGPRIQLTAGEGQIVLSTHLDATRLPAWQLPRTFDPYYLTRILRGTPHGLSLFLVQVIAHSHGGRAVARWTADGQLCLEVALLPSHPEDGH